MDLKLLFPLLKESLQVSIVPQPRVRFNLAEILMLWFLGVAIILLGSYVWYFAVATSGLTGEPINNFIPITEQSRQWKDQVLSINFIVGSFAVIMYGLFMSANLQNHIVRWTFGAWTFAWLCQLLGVIFAEKSKGDLFIVFESYSSMAIVFGSLYAKRSGDRYSQWTFIFALLPGIAGLVSAIFSLNYWPFSLVNCIVLICFVTVIGDIFRKSNPVPTYFLMACYGIYAGIQLLFPIMDVFPVGSLARQFISILGYTLGILAKGGGAFGLLLVWLTKQWRPSTQVIVENITTATESGVYN